MCIQKCLIVCMSVHRYTNAIREQLYTYITYSGAFDLPDSKDCIIFDTMSTTLGLWSPENVRRSNPLLVSLTSDRESEFSAVASGLGDDKQEASRTSLTPAITKSF